MIFAPLEQFEILSIINLRILNLDISITNFLITQVISCLVLFFILSCNSAEKFSFYYISNSWQKIFELYFNFIFQLIFTIKDNETYLPFLVFLFNYILFSNLIGLIPYSFTVTSHIITTFYISFSVFLGINFIVIEKYGFKSFALFLPPSTPFLLAIILVPIEFLTYLAKPISLGVRLFINLMAGHILMKIIVGFSWNLLLLENYLSFLFIIPLATLVILFGLELGVALIQTYVLMVLVWCVISIILLLVELADQHGLFLIIIKTLDSPKSSIRSIVQKNRQLQHVKKGIPRLIQHSLERIPSYREYAYFSSEKLEIVPFIKGWSILRFLALQFTANMFCTRVAEMFSKNSNRNQYAKFTEVYTVGFLGGNMYKSLRILKGSNFYDIRVLVLARRFGSKGGQLKSSDKEDLVTKNSFDLLKDIANGKFNTSRNVYCILCDPKVLKKGYSKLKSNSILISGLGSKDFNDSGITEQYFNDLASKLKKESYQPKPMKRVFIPSKTGSKRRSLTVPVIEDKIVEQALLYLLEAVFEKKFSDTSHGFRSDRSAHFVCKNIRLWKGVCWFIEGGIENYFDTINHKKLIEIINLEIKDQQVIDLL